MIRKSAPPLVLMMVALATGGPVAAADKDVQIRLSCPPAARGQRITAINLQLTAGRFTAVSALPEGWDVHIDNDPSLHSKLEGSTSIGAGALDCSLIRKISIFYRRTPIGDLDFELSGSIITTADFQSEKVITLNKGNFR